MAKKKQDHPEIVEADDQTPTVDVRHALANQPSQTGQNGYEYTNRDDDVKDPNRREGLGE